MTLYGNYALLFKRVTRIAEYGNIGHIDILICTVITDIFLCYVFLRNVYVVFGYVYIVVEVEQCVCTEKLKRLLFNECHNAVSRASELFGIDNILKLDA